MEKIDKQPKGIILSQERYSELLEKEQHTISDEEMHDFRSKQYEAEKIINDSELTIHVYISNTSMTIEKHSCYRDDVNTVIHGSNEEIKSELQGILNEHIKKVTTVDEIKIEDKVLKKKIQLLKWIVIILIITNLIILIF